VNKTTHQNLILDQFPRQAAPFSAAAMIKDEAVLRLIVEAALPRPDDTVLDVACGSWPCGLRLRTACAPGEGYRPDLGYA